MLNSREINSILWQRHNLPVKQLLSGNIYRNSLKSNIKDSIGPFIPPNQTRVTVENFEKLCHDNGLKPANLLLSWKTNPNNQYNMPGSGTYCTVCKNMEVYLHGERSYKCRSCQKWRTPSGEKTQERGVNQRLAPTSSFLNPEVKFINWVQRGGYVLGEPLFMVHK